MIRIETERLVLRKPGEGDKQSLIAQIGDWEVAQWLSRVPYPYTENDADSWIRTLSGKELSFCIFENDALIGGVGLSPQEDGGHQLGYWLGRRHWGRGFATEAGRGLLRYAVEDLGIGNITSSYMKGNDASARVLEKLGFIESGEGETYSLSLEETRPHINMVLP